MNEPRPAAADPKPHSPAAAAPEVSGWRTWKWWHIGVLTLVVAGAAVWVWWLTHPKTLADPLQPARAALAAHDFDAARGYLRGVLERWPLDAEAHFLLARACRRADDLAGWQEHLHAAEALQWPPMEVERERLYAKVQAGDVWDAEAQLAPELAAAGDEAVVAVDALVKGFLTTFCLDDVLEYTQGWIDRRPADWLPHSFRGRAYLSAHMPARAVEEFRRALELNSGHAPTRLELAGALLIEAQFEPAREQYEVFLASRPPSAEALYGLAYCQFKLAQPEAARSTLERLFALDPEHPAGCYIRAQLEMQADPATALVWLRKAERRAPRETDITYALIQVLSQLGRKEEADRYRRQLDALRADLARLDELRQAVRKAPDRPAPRFEAGKLCAALGRDGEAARWLQSVLRLAPNHAGARAALADLHERSADPRAGYHRSRTGTAR
jgi:tetratricopeptide (TPR) repeat protein